MDDEKIISLYWQRDENAILKTKEKYGRLCFSVAYNILSNEEDAKECENDTYFEIWNSIPPQKPLFLSSFLATISRRNALDRYRKNTAKRRGGEEFILSINELEECIPSDKSIDQEINSKGLANAISTFLKNLPEIQCNVFLRRYWYFDSISEICNRYGFKESRVKTMLLRTRKKLLIYLEKEGFFI